MAKPLPPVVIPPASASGGAHNPSDVPTALWTAITKAAAKNGVTPQVLAGIWRVESGSTYPNPAVNSSGYGGLFGTTNWNGSTQDQADLAASVLRNLIRQRGNLHDALLAYSGGGYSTVPGVSVPRTSAQKVADATRDEKAKLNSPDYLNTKAQLSATLALNRKELEQQQHFNDPWITVVKKNGKVIGFGQATGVTAPADVFKIGGVDATKSLFDGQWSQYGNDFEAYTGRKATPAEQAKIISSGVSQYTLRGQLAEKPAFTSSPIYRAHASGIAQQVKDALGHPADPNFVKAAIAEGWDSDTLAANIKKLPSYANGPAAKQAQAGILSVYQQIYGNIQKGDTAANAWVKQAAVAGWTQDQAAAALRADPAYKYSPEYQSKAIGFLDAMGMFTGQRSILVPGNTPKPGPSGLEAPLNLHPAVQSNAPVLPGAVPLPSTGKTIMLNGHDSGVPDTPENAQALVEAARRVKRTVVKRAAKA